MINIKLHVIFSKYYVSELNVEYEKEEKLGDTLETVNLVATLSVCVLD